MAQLKRLNWEPGLRIGDVEGTTEQDYWNDKRKRHLAYEHGAGIVEGFDVVPGSTDYEVEIGYGRAITTDGFDILFDGTDVDDDPSQTLDLSAYIGDTVYILLTALEVDRDPYPHEGSGDQYKYKKDIIEFDTTVLESGWDENQVEVARVTVPGSGPITSDDIDTDSRELAFSYQRLSVEATPNSIAERDSGGRSQVADPVKYDDIANKRWAAERQALATASTINWQPRIAAEQNYWLSVTWSPELGLFCAVAISGTNRVMTSPDGITWTARTAAEQNSWYSVTWSPELGLFCAVASSGTNRVMTSPDGITWTARTAAEQNFWYSVTWSPELGLFCAVATSGTNRVMTSPDGITWTARTAAEQNSWYSVTWSPELGLFCAVASIGTNRVMTSPDGITWTARTAAEQNPWRSVTWSPELGLFCAVASSGTNRVMTSPDGITWTARTAAEQNFWYSVTWSPELGLFCAVATSGTNRVMTSPDGITWTARTAAEQNSWYSVTWSPELGLFCAVATSGDFRVMTSSFHDYTPPIRAWVKFEGYSTPTRLGNYNVSSVVHEDDGRWTVHFETPMPTTTYGVLVTARSHSGGIRLGFPEAQGTETLAISVVDGSQSYNDLKSGETHEISVAVIL